MLDSLIPLDSLVTGRVRARRAAGRGHRAEDDADDHEREPAADAERALRPALQPLAEHEPGAQEGRHRLGRGHRRQHVPQRRHLERALDHEVPQDRRHDEPGQVDHQGDRHERAQRGGQPAQEDRVEREADAGGRPHHHRRPAPLRPPARRQQGAGADQPDHDPDDRGAADVGELAAGTRLAHEHQHADADGDERGAQHLRRGRPPALDHGLERERPHQRRGDHGLHEDDAALRQRPRLHEQGQHRRAAAGEPARVAQQAQQQPDRADVPVRHGRRRRAAARCSRRRTAAPRPARR